MHILHKFIFNTVNHWKISMLFKADNMAKY